MEYESEWCRECGETFTEEDFETHDCTSACTLVPSVLSKVPWWRKITEIVIGKFPYDFRGRRRFFKIFAVSIAVVATEIYAPGIPEVLAGGRDGRRKESSSIYWVKGGSGDWDDPDNWSDRCVPRDGDSVIFPPNTGRVEPPEKRVNLDRVTVMGGDIQFGDGTLTDLYLSGGQVRYPLSEERKIINLSTWDNDR